MDGLAHLVIQVGHTPTLAYPAIGTPRIPAPQAGDVFPAPRRAAAVAKVLVFTGAGLRRRAAHEGQPRGLRREKPSRHESPCGFTAVSLANNRHGMPFTAVAGRLNGPLR
jgi:hypothetical protein